MASNPAGPDVRQLRDQKLQPGDFPGGRNQEFRVCFDPAVHAEIWKHGSQDTSVEICGVLVGRIASDSQGAFVHVSASIRGEAANNKFAEVTFTHETWNRINREMDTKFTDKSIVGWYHTHPNFGIFLSERDQFICQNFFSGPGQIAHVVDPVRKLEGVFVWRDGKAQPTPFYWVADKLLTHPPEQTPETSASGMGQSPAASVSMGEVLSAEPIPGTPFWMNALFVTLMFMLGWLLHGYVGDAQLNAVKRDAIAQVYMRLLLRPGLETDLGTVKKQLRNVELAVNELSQQHLQLVAGVKDVDAEKKEQVTKVWEGLKGETAQLQMNLQAIEQQYCLSPAELQALDTMMANQQRRQNAEGARQQPVPETTNKTKTGEKTAQPKPKETKSEGKQPSGENSVEKKSGGKPEKPIESKSDDNKPKPEPEKTSPKKGDAAPADAAKPADTLPPSKP